MMKNKIPNMFRATVVALMALVIPLRPVAQGQPASTASKQHSKYKLIDLGTFGGPQSYVPDGGGITAATVLNNHGMFSGSADTSASDPFPDFCVIGMHAKRNSPLIAAGSPMMKLRPRSAVQHSKRSNSIRRWPSRMPPWRG